MVNFKNIKTKLKNSINEKLVFTRLKLNKDQPLKCAINTLSNVANRTNLDYIVSFD
jgi:hypothetical protein